MSILKLKGIIYQKTGIYLASKEELEYIKSDEFWKSFMKMITHKANDMSGSNIQGLLIGLWQTKYGFYRAMKRTRKWKKKK